MFSHFESVIPPKIPKQKSFSYENYDNLHKSYYKNVLGVYSQTVACDNDCIINDIKYSSNPKARQVYNYLQSATPIQSENYLLRLYCTDETLSKYTDSLDYNNNYQTFDKQKPKIYKIKDKITNKVTNHLDTFGAPFSFYSKSCEDLSQNFVKRESVSKPERNDKNVVVKNSFSVNDVKQKSKAPAPITPVSSRKMFSNTKNLLMKETNFSTKVGKNKEPTAYSKFMEKPVGMVTSTPVENCLIGKKLKEKVNHPKQVQNSTKPPKRGDIILRTDVVPTTFDSGFKSKSVTKSKIDKKSDFDFLNNW